MPVKIKILYIDDEHNNLVGFKAAFRVNYDIFIAENTSSAVAYLEKYPDLRVIFCDQRMPDQTGVEFFEKVREQFPLPVRVLLTGYADIEAVIGAINRGNIFRYVKKPWANADIISAIGEANNFYLANSMLAVKNTELQKAYDELDKFAYSVSHDLRGPLSGVLGAIHVARDMQDLNEMKNLLNLMEKSVEKLDKYILSMHDYYSLQRGELKITEIDFHSLAEEFRDIYEAYSDAAHIIFNIKVHQAETFRTDEMALKLVINNLLSNAFKYQKKNAQHKAVELNVTVAVGIAIISISDTGVGILETYFGEIFNLFSRAISQEAGSGLGLYNVKGALIKLNGQIEVNSVLNSGTTFKVTIPSK